MQMLSFMEFPYMLLAAKSHPFWISMLKSTAASYALPETYITRLIDVAGTPIFVEARIVLDPDLDPLVGVVTIFLEKCLWKVALGGSQLWEGALMRLFQLGVGPWCTDPCTVLWACGGLCRLASMLNMLRMLKVDSFNAMFSEERATFLFIVPSNFLYSACAWL